MVFGRIQGDASPSRANEVCEPSKGWQRFWDFWAICPDCIAARGRPWAGPVPPAVKPVRAGEKCGSLGCGNRFPEEKAKGDA